MEHYSDTAFGVCGWGFMWVPPPMGASTLLAPSLLGLAGAQHGTLIVCRLAPFRSLPGVVPVYLTYLQRGPAGTMVCCCSRDHDSTLRKEMPGKQVSHIPERVQVDVLQACCGNAYRVSWFNSAKLKNDLPPECFTTDDLWIAGYLSAQGDIKKVRTHHTHTPHTPHTHHTHTTHTTRTHTVLANTCAGDHSQAFGPGLARVEGERAQEVASLHRQHQRHEGHEVHQRRQASLRYRSLPPPYSLASFHHLCAR